MTGKTKINLHASAKDHYVLWNLREAREESGVTAKDLAEATGVSKQMYYQYERLRALPNDGVAAKIAETLGRPVQDLFPANLAEIVKEVKEERKYCSRPEGINFVPLDADSFYEDMRRPNNPFDPVEDAQKYGLRETFSKLLKTLSYRGREVLKLRYGLGDGYTYTLEEIGALFRSSPDRIRQIEVGALQKLQLPNRREKLKPYWLELK